MLSLVLCIASQLILLTGTQSELIDIPLIVYKRGSDLGKGIQVTYPPAESDQSNLPDPKLPTGGADGDTSYSPPGVTTTSKRDAPSTSVLTKGLSPERAQSNLDIVGTVCGLLGIPVPRQTVGLVMEEAIDALVRNISHREAVYRDLFLQKKGFVYEYFKAINADLDQLTSIFDYSSWDRNMTDDCLTNRNGNNYATPQAREECYKSNANQLMLAYYANRDETFTSRITRNVLLNMTIVVTILGIAIAIMQRFSYADPVAIPVFVVRKLLSALRAVRRFYFSRRQSQAFTMSRTSILLRCMGCAWSFMHTSTSTCSARDGSSGRRCDGRSGGVRGRAADGRDQVRNAHARRQYRRHRPLLHDQRTRCRHILRSAGTPGIVLRVAFPSTRLIPRDRATDGTSPCGTSPRMRISTSR